MRHSALASIVLLATLPAAAQSPTRTQTGSATQRTKTWTPPRTPDGQPDLHGVWLNNSATPLERPKALEGKEFLSDEELAELKKRARRLFDANGDADFVGGDGFFLALLANPGQFRNPDATGTAANMVERQFERRTSLIVDPPDGKIPPLTPEGHERLARRPTENASGPRRPAGPEDLSTALRCITYGVPRLGGNAASYNSYYQIVQAPGYFVLASEVIHDARVIPLNGRPHLPGNIRQWHGDSRGRWEGNTLVVDTTNFSPRSNFMGSSENLHLSERFMRVAPDAIDYELTLTDPTTWTRPWTAMVHLKRTEDKIYEYACHEGNYHTMLGMLGAARAEEKAAAKPGAQNPPR
jgi:hypothetical protein